MKYYVCTVPPGHLWIHMTWTPRSTCEIVAVRVAVHPQFSTVDLCQSNGEISLFNSLSFLRLLCWMLNLPCYTFSFFSNTCSLNSKLVLKAQIETRSFLLGARVLPLFLRKWSLNCHFDSRFICLIIFKYLGRDYTLSALLSFLDEVNLVKYGWISLYEPCFFI